VLRDRPHRHRILNGVDYDEWSPQADKFIVGNTRLRIIGKAACKQDLLAAFGVKNADRRFGNWHVSRFAAQKGFDLIAQSWTDWPRRDDRGRPGRGR